MLAHLGILGHIYIYIYIYNYVMVGELPKLPNDTIQPYMHDITDVCEHANIHDMHNIYKRVVNINRRLNYKCKI